jgi:geranylgeranyl pyrophosphate synthase
VYDLALAGGASEQNSEFAGVAVELFYAACSLTDDIQDEEAEYAGDDVAHQVNAQSILICAAFMALTKLSSVYSFGVGGIRMLKGQLRELSFDDRVSIEDYIIVAEAIAGAAYEEYLKLVAVAIMETSGDRDEHVIDLWKRYGHALGVLIHLIADSDTKDPRWTGIDDLDRDEYAVHVFQTFSEVADEMPRLGVVEKLTKLSLERAKWVLFGQVDGITM